MAGADGLPFIGTCRTSACAGLAALSRKEEEEEEEGAFLFLSFSSFITPEDAFSLSFFSLSLCSLRDVGRPSSAMLLRVSTACGCK
jgi:hypothetical protein